MVQRDDERFQLRLVLHARRALDAAVHVDETRVRLRERFADVCRVQAAGENPDVAGICRLVSREFSPVAGVAGAAKRFVVKRVEQDELRDGAGGR
jgi:hypothetical protein